MLGLFSWALALVTMLTTLAAVLAVLVAVLLVASPTMASFQAKIQL